MSPEAFQLVERLEEAAGDHSLELAHSYGGYVLKAERELIIARRQLADYIGELERRIDEQTGK